MLKLSNHLSGRNIGLLLIVLLSLTLKSCEQKQALLKFNYESNYLELTEYFVKDSLRTLTLDSLSDRKPLRSITLKEVNAFSDKLWNVALADIESNLVETENGTYFGAGQKFGIRIYTRDISFSGILGVSQLYPEKILSSLRVTRDIRRRLGFTVPKGYVVPGIEIDWKELDMTSIDFLNENHTNCYTRRTDDVVWLWAANDLFDKNPDLADWEWLYVTGKKFFEEFYNPFFDDSSGLFRGQAAFIDIHYIDALATGYPKEFSISDCVMIKPLSTNCLYYKGLLAMAHACNKTGRDDEAVYWNKKAVSLKNAILDGLRNPDGTFAYFMHKDGSLEPRREALGTALAVITGIVSGEEAEKCLEGYPVTWAGVPLLHPFYPWKGYYHNNTSWPYVDTFFLWAREICEGKDYTGMNAALLARTCIGSGSFHEVVNWTTREPYGSGSQLWSASAYVNTCIRAGLID